MVSFTCKYAKHSDDLRCSSEIAEEMAVGALRGVVTQNHLVKDTVFVIRAFSLGSENVDFCTNVQTLLQLWALRVWFCASPETQYFSSLKFGPGRSLLHEAHVSSN